MCTQYEFFYKNLFKQDPKNDVSGSDPDPGPVMKIPDPARRSGSGSQTLVRLHNGTDYSKLWENL
jgi:hypothetical protein